MLDDVVDERGPASIDGRVERVFEQHNANAQSGFFTYRSVSEQTFGEETFFPKTRQRPPTHLNLVYTSVAVGVHIGSATLFLMLLFLGLGVRSTGWTGILFTLGIGLVLIGFSPLGCVRCCVFVGCCIVVLRLV